MTALASAQLSAHHSIAMVDVSSPVWMHATVVRYEPRHPHVLIHVEERRPDGRVQRLTLEGPIVARLQRMHLARDFLKPGDAIAICGFPFRGQASGSMPALHAHVVVLPDGRWQPWGPYGKLENCMRIGDSVDHWVSFIGDAPMAHEYWCKSLRMTTVPSLAPRPLLDEVLERAATTCR